MLTKSIKLTTLSSFKWLNLLNGEMMHDVKQWNFSNDAVKFKWKRISHQKKKNLSREKTQTKCTTWVVHSICMHWIFLSNSRINLFAKWNWLYKSLDICYNIYLSNEQLILMISGENKEYVCMTLKFAPKWQKNYIEKPTTNAALATVYYNYTIINEPNQNRLSKIQISKQCRYDATTFPESAFPLYCIFPCVKGKYLYLIIC